MLEQDVPYEQLGDYMEKEFSAIVKDMEQLSLDRQSEENCHGREDRQIAGALKQMNVFRATVCAVGIN